MATRNINARLTAEDRASSKLKRFGGVLAGVGAIAATVGAAKLGRAFVGGVEKAIDASTQYEAAGQRLTLAVRNSGLDTDRATKALKGYAKELVTVSNFTETEIIMAEQLAVSMGATEETAKATALAATNLSVALGLDASTAIRQVTRTLGGYAGELGEVIPELKNFTQEQLRAGKGVEFLNSKFAGFGEEGAKTFEGRINNVNSALDQLRVAIGTPITDALGPILVTVTDFLGELTEGIEGNDAAIRDFVQSSLLIAVDAFRTLAKVMLAVAERGVQIKEFFEGAKVDRLRDEIDTLSERQDFLNRVIAAGTDEQGKMSNQARGAAASLAHVTQQLDHSKEALDELIPRYQATIKAEKALQKVDQTLEDLHGRLVETINAGSEAADKESMALTNLGGSAAFANEELAALFENMVSFPGIPGLFPGGSGGFDVQDLPTGKDDLEGEGFDTSLIGVPDIDAIREGNELRIELEEELVDTLIAEEDRLTKAIMKAETDRMQARKQAGLAVAQAAHGLAVATFGDSKALAAAGVVIDTAGAIMSIQRVWAAYPPVAAALTALTVATGAVQLAKINSTDLKAREGAIVPGLNTGQDSVSVLAQPGEAILPRELTEFLTAAAAGQGGGEMIEVRVTSDIPLVIEEVSRSVRKGEGDLIATRLAGDRSTR